MGAMPEKLAISVGSGEFDPATLQSLQTAGRSACANRPAAGQSVAVASRAATLRRICGTLAIVGDAPGASQGCVADFGFLLSAGSIHSSGRAGAGAQHP